MYPHVHGRRCRDRDQTPDSVLAGWPEEVNALVEQIYADFNEKHGTDYKFQLKK